MPDTLGDQREDAISAINGLKKSGITSDEEIIAIATGDQQTEHESGRNLRRVFISSLRITKDRQLVISELQRIFHNRNEDPTDESVAVEQIPERDKLITEFLDALKPFQSNQDNAAAIDNLALQQNHLTPEQHKLNEMISRMLAAGMHIEIRQLIHKAFFPEA